MGDIEGMQGFLGGLFSRRPVFCSVGLILVSSWNNSSELREKVLSLAFKAAG
jgi:hypothetical protein